MAKKSKKLNCSWKRKPKNAPSADIAHAVIEEIRHRRGAVTPQLLVIDAKKKKSPLHGCFEWDDSKAAEQHRVTQARNILSYICVEVEQDEPDEKPQQVRAFIAPSSVGKDSKTSYVPVDEVRNDAEMQSAYLHQLQNELNSIKNKIKSFKEFAAVVRAIDRVKIS